MSDQELTADPHVRQAARATARRLAEELSPSLPAQVEAVLAADGPDGADGGYGGSSGLFTVDVVALGSLIVSAASLAWTVVSDRRKEAAKKASREDVAQRLRLELELPADEGVTGEQRDRIIEIVVEEVVGDLDLVDGEE